MGYCITCDAFGPQADKKENLNQVKGFMIKMSRIKPNQKYIKTNMYVSTVIINTLYKVYFLVSGALLLRDNLCVLRVLLIYLVMVM